MTDRVRNPTILDVARLAGVSKSVVSRVLTGRGSVGAPARRRVLDAASELGYVVNAVARAMAAHRTHTLGVFVRDAATPFYGHLLTAMQERASHHGYRVVTATGSGKFEVAAERRALETLVMLQVEGLVVCSGLLPAHDVVPFAERIPTIVAGRPETHASITSVFCDEDEGGARLAEHVVGLGHRTVAVVRLDADQSLTMAPRTAAMARRLRELGAAVVEMAGGQVDELASVAQALGEAPAVTAVMAPSDIHAVRLMELLAEAGVDVPGRMSVTGYDGIGALRTSLIGLTTWRQPIDQLGVSAVDAVVRLLDDHPAPPHHQALAGELVRGRTAVSPAGVPSSDVYPECAAGSLP
jgi:DNA-binding LacI/PurR family transcriptional regulator